VKLTKNKTKGEDKIFLILYEMALNKSYNLFYLRQALENKRKRLKRISEDQRPNGFKRINE
ncbi:MAG: hypothetical protein JW812_03050, partial [Alphaproteobacteria bacterium]|nr:hypothetical protein [Alphaproteobacteria bacterium]